MEEFAELGENIELKFFLNGPLSIPKSTPTLSQITHTPEK